ncbi:MAG TPA: chemotaxis protein CheW [Rectinemataceae bacterium]|nr:chemotaxis protein CheW [Rectinemataceae bacterium]
MRDTESGRDFDQYLTFRLGEEQYAFRVDAVREVIEYTRITRLPRMSETMRGVINIRGAVIPVFDLKLLFGMGRTQEATDTSIVVLEIRGSRNLAAVGVLADSVQEVIRLDPGTVEPPPTLGIGAASRAVTGIGKLGDEFVTILDIDEALDETGKELHAAEEAVAEAV